MSGLHVRGRKEARGKKTKGELGRTESPASGPVISNQGFNFQEHNCFLSGIYRKLLISLPSICSNQLNTLDTNPSRLSHKAPSNISKHTVSNPKTQGLKCPSKPSRSVLSPPRLSLCNWWLSWLRQWSVQEVYTKMLWQRDKQTGTHSGDSVIRKRRLLSE